MRNLLIAVLLITGFSLMAQVVPKGGESQGSEAKTDTTKKVKFAGIPIINYDRTYEFYAGGMAALFYKVNKKDTISPSSSTGIVGVYTTNKSYFLSAYQLLYWNEDRWRFTGALGLGTMFLQYFYSDPVTDGGHFVDYNTSLSMVYLHLERETFKDLYFGLLGAYVDAETEFDYLDPETDEKIIDKRNLNTLGFSLSYDNRDHQYTPSKGFYWNYKNLFFRDWLGSDNKFNKHDIEFNSFFNIKGDKQVLATRFKAVIASGDVPFQGQTAIGGDDLRGYTQGKYRNDQVYALQAEYRKNIYKKFGMVGFFGVASAVDSFSDIFNREVLPGGGIGFRYMMVPSEKINVGIDFGAGRDDWSITFRIGEAFGRK